MSLDTEPRNIPAAIQQRTRHRCGFGCVICGCEVGVEYDHIVDYSIVRRHDEENITLLCGTCHNRKTRGLLSQEALQKYNRNPHNLRDGSTPPWSLDTSSTLTLRIGSNELTLDKSDSAAALVIDNSVLLSLQRRSDHCALNIDLRDRSNRTLLAVRDNFISHRIDMWDTKWVGQTLTIRSAPRKILLRMRLERDLVTIEAGRFFANGVEVLIEAGKLTLPTLGDINRRWSATDVDAMFALGRCSVGSASVWRLDPPRVSFNDLEVARWIDATKYD